MELDTPVTYYDEGLIPRAARVTASTPEQYPPLAEWPAGTVSLLVMRPDAVQAYPVVQRSETPAAVCWTPLP